MELSSLNSQTWHLSSRPAQSIIRSTRRSRHPRDTTSLWLTPGSNRDTRYAYGELFEEIKWLKSANIHIMEKLQRPTPINIKLWSVVYGRAMNEPFIFNAHHSPRNSLRSHRPFRPNYITLYSLPSLTPLQVFLS